MDARRRSRRPVSVQDLRSLAMNDEPGPDPVGLVVRRATPEDLPGIVAVLADDDVGGHGDTLDPDAAPAYETALAAILANPNERLFVAVLDGEVVGTFQMTFIRTLAHRGRLRAVVEAVHVAAARRSRGIGAAMMARAMAEARTSGAGVVTLTSNKRRLDAHRFYERLGFARSHEGFKMELG
jgi:GNAT superfamily N-acetyltransferase